MGSWAEQWGNDAQVPLPEEKKSGGATAKYGKKMGEGLVKTKAVATTGVNKVKEGTHVGFRWIKDKWQKTTRKR
ncbi:hypothetical protein OROGR_004549 [Orobanche gracilis]